MYAEWADQIINMPPELAGEYTKAILKYAIYGEDVKTDNELLNAMLIPVYKRIDIDAAAWEETKKQRSEAGKKGMAKRWHNGAITNDNNVITNDNSVTEAITPITIPSFSVTTKLSGSFNTKFSLGSFLYLFFNSFNLSLILFTIVLY